MNSLQKWLQKNEHSLPEPFSGSRDPGWTKYSIVERLPEITRRVITENSFPESIVRRIESLITEIPDAAIAPIDRDDHGDWTVWNRLLEPYLGLNWLEAPWLVVEFYLYRRILAAIGYFDDGPYFRFDPYTYQKKAGFKAALGSINAFLSWLDAEIESQTPGQAIFENLLLHNLEGNRIDLSLWPVNSEKPAQQMPAQGMTSDFLLVNDAAKAAQWVFERGAVQIDVVMDNAGDEMLGDLAMMLFLLEQGAAERVVAHVKPYPVFVSDVIREDIHLTIRNLLALKGEWPRLAEFGQKLEKNLSEGSLIIRDEGFWGLPLAFWQMDADTYRNLSSSGFIITKGDANYRRLLGDLHWEAGYPFGQVVSYLPAPLLAIRVVKSDPLAGIPAEDFNRMASSDPHWMKDGKWGAFQFWDGL
jgi:uncharacterized protein with ATP-grasp and redox domains